MPHKHVSEWGDEGGPVILYDMQMGLDDVGAVTFGSGTCYACPEFPEGHPLIGDPVAHLRAVGRLDD